MTRAEGNGRRRDRSRHHHGSVDKRDGVVRARWHRAQYGRRALRQDVETRRRSATMLRLVGVDRNFDRPGVGLARRHRRLRVDASQSEYDDGGKYSQDHHHDQELNEGESCVRAFILREGMAPCVHVLILRVHVRSNKYFVCNFLTIKHNSGRNLNFLSVRWVGGNRTHDRGITMRVQAVG